MDDSKERNRRYLLGELSEGERSTFEEAYFGDPRVFAEVADAENALVDDYVRGRLSADMRRRFEQAYAADPHRRERVRFAQALATSLDTAASANGASDIAPRTSGSDWRNWIPTLSGSAPAFRWGLASLLIVMAAGGFWRFFQSAQSRQEPARAAVEQPPPAGVAPVTPANPAAPDSPVTPASSVTLALTVGPGVRSVEPGGPVTLGVPTGTSEVRLMLNLREHSYPTYRVVLRAVGGAEVLRRGDLTPSTQGSGAAFSLAIPASRFSAGDYMLTLQGKTGSGEFEDLSQSLFRVRLVR